MKIRLFTALLLAGSLVGLSPAHAAVFPLIEPCSKSTNIPCIETFTMIDQQGNKFEGKLTGKSSPSTRGFASQIYQGTEWEWEVPGITQPNGNTFFNLLGEFFPLGAPYCWLPNQPEAQCDHTIDEIAFWVYPSTNYSTAPPSHFPKLPSDKICGTENDPQYCFQIWDLNEKYQYVVKLKIPPSFEPGMMAANGRTGSAVAINNSDGSQSLLLSGTPTENLWTINNPPLTPPADESSLAVSGRVELSFFVQSKKSAQSQWANRCNEGAIVSYWHNTGIGTTPVWSPEDSAIVMDTGGPHFRADGTLNTGLIELQIPVKMATCLWGVDLSRKVSATMTATYANGSAPEVIATRSSVDGGVYTLSSLGFHYSTPRIKVKLEQEVSEPLAPVVPKIDVPKVTTQKKVISITCTKGKTVKKVTSAAPKCPAGYTLKKK